MYGKISVNTSNGSRINVFGFSYDDAYQNPLLATIDWKNLGGGVNFHLIPNGSNIIVDGLVGFSTYSVGIDEMTQNLEHLILMNSQPILISHFLGTKTK